VPKCSHKWRGVDITPKYNHGTKWAFIKMNTKKHIWLILFSFTIQVAIACDDSSSNKSDYILEITSNKSSSDSCLTISLLLQKRSELFKNRFLSGAIMHISEFNKKNIVEIELNLREIAEDRLYTQFCIDERYIESSEVKLWFLYQPTVALGKSGTYSVGGIACTEEDTLSLGKLIKNEE
jgi:hypothetical protein